MTSLPPAMDEEEKLKVEAEEYADQIAGGRFDQAPEVMGSLVVAGIIWFAVTMTLLLVGERISDKAEVAIICVVWVGHYLIKKKRNDKWVAAYLQKRYYED